VASSKPRSRRLVIVESPAKARTIAGYLGPEFEVEASIGHIRDLPQPSELPTELKKGPLGKFSVDVDNGFAAYYVVDADKKRKVADLKRSLKDSDELFLATDEDREGEAIAWHLLEVLQPKVPVRRMVFHEITREAIQRALRDTRELDERLVDAQETRRILDRLYGYEVSPVLWRKVRAGLSAGRVQSVATRLVVERERERVSFRSASYWDINGVFVPVAENSDSPGTPNAAAGEFTARLLSLDGVRVAAGKDFDDRGRLLPGSAGQIHLDRARADDLLERLRNASVRVGSVEEKPYRRSPAPPFTTSTLQQEASRKLRMSSKKAMRVAQSLYENGYITYMRTDSTVLSDQALSAARRQASELYGPDFVPSAPRVYPNKSKNAQEAHEAVRPSGDSFRTPAQVAGEIHGDEYRLYELIWKRTVASQMGDARGATASVRLRAPLAPPAGGCSDPVRAESAEFTASGTVITFRGFLAAYEEGRDEERNSDRAEVRRLPELAAGDALDTHDLQVAGHETSSPPRYTEASLVKALEERGIGRPSTYAATISVIQDRGYVTAKGSALVPTWVAFSVTRLLEEHFSRLVDYDFTASMEADLDRIAAGDEERVLWLSRFYFGDEHSVGLRPLVENLGDIDARDVNSVAIGEGIVLRVGRYGPYLEAAGDGDEPRRASVPDTVAPDELTVEKAKELLASSADGDRDLGTDPESGRQIVARAGRFGPYVTEVLEENAPKSLKPRTASLFRSMQTETVTLEQSLLLLSLPRVVGADPQTGEEITAQNGRYGPYLRRGTDSRSLTSEEQIFEITLEQALAVYAQPKARGRQAAAPPLRELGTDPHSGGLVVVKEGRFGPYVTDGVINATLRKADEVESVTLERAAELLAEKRAKEPAPRRKAADRTPAKKAVTKKAVTKKAPAKKTVTKKTAAKKTVTKKTAAKKPTAKAKTSAGATATGPAGNGAIENGTASSGNGQKPQTRTAVGNKIGSTGS
jgi:DNA topoisomerase I